MNSDANYMMGMVAALSFMVPLQDTSDNQPSSMAVNYSYEVEINYF